MTGTPPRSYRSFLFAAIAYLLVAQTNLFVLSLGPALAGHADFRTSYCTGYLVRSGHAWEIYDYQTQKQVQNALVAPSSVAVPFYHPAYEALLFVPFSLASYRVAYFLFMTLNLALLFVSAMIVQPYLPGLAVVWRPLPVALFVLFFPAGIALMQGQDSILLLLLYCSAFVAISAEKKFLAGCFLGLALMKFQITLPVVALFLIWRRWREIAGFATTGFSVLIASVWLVGFRVSLTYARSLFSMSSILATPAERVNYGFPRVMPNLRGLVSSLGEGRLSHFWLQVAIAGLSILVFVWSARKRECNEEQGSALALSILCALLVSFYLQIHDLTVLIIPIALALDRAAQKSAAAEGCIRAAALPGLFLVQPVYLFLTTQGLLWMLCLPILALLFLWPQSNPRLPGAGPPLRVS